MISPKLTKGPERYTVQQLRRKAEDFTNYKVPYSYMSEAGNWVKAFLEYLEAQK